MFKLGNHATAPDLWSNPQQPSVVCGVKNPKLGDPFFLWLGSGSILETLDFPSAKRGELLRNKNEVGRVLVTETFGSELKGKQPRTSHPPGPRFLCVFLGELNQTHPKPSRGPSFQEIGKRKHCRPLHANSTVKLECGSQTGSQNRIRTPFWLVSKWKPRGTQPISSGPLLSETSIYLSNKTNTPLSGSDSMLSEDVNIGAGPLVRGLQLWFAV